jgi:hypothetical protein
MTNDELLEIIQQAAQTAPRFVTTRPLKPESEEGNYDSKT